ncbi:MAG TPA: hypothetical protein VJV78_46520 [Polyangiales bacterium]|nr:hypothetical protein [Polyangiales bacterium]
MVIRREWAIWAALAFSSCNTFDEPPPDDDFPRDFVTPPSVGFAPSVPMSGFGVAGSPASFAPAGRGAPVPAAGSGGMPVRWQPIDAGPPVTDADGGADDAGQ